LWEEAELAVGIDVVDERVDVADWLAEDVDRAFDVLDREDAEDVDERGIEKVKVAEVDVPARTCNICAPSLATMGAWRGNAARRSWRSDGLRLV
jgi:hypothetical protein